MRIIEAGCGLGGWISYFKRLGFHITGVEYEQSVADKAKQFEPDLPIVVGDVLNLDFPDSSFDVYISLGVVEHFEEGPMQAINEARRVLKPGGLAFFTVPCSTGLRSIFSHPLRNIFFLGWRSLGKPKYFWEYRYTREELANFLIEANFEIIHTEIDDYLQNDNDHHIGLYADYFFLRSKNGDIWGLNKPGKFFLSVFRKFGVSPWFYCSGVHIVAKNRK